MSTSKRSVYDKVYRVLRLPLGEKVEVLRTGIARFKSAYYYPRVFGGFGKGAVIERTNRITHPECIRIGERTSILYDATIEPIVEYATVQYSPRIEIGRDVYIGPHVYIACVGRLSIGDECVLSENVYLNDTNHGFDPEGGLIMKQELVHAGDITIGKSCFLGLRSAIMPGVTLGDHCVVGTSSVVTKSFPAYSMIAGAPAVLIKRYSVDEKRWVRVKSA